MPTLFLGENMIASSVTGVGPGDSNGKYKPKNNCSCSCCCSSSTQSTPTIIKKGCFRNYNLNGSSSYKINNNSSQIKIC